MKLSGAIITGASSSVTVMICVPVVVLSQGSVPVNVLTISYEPKQEPGIITSSTVMVTTPQSSVPEASPNSAPSTKSQDIDIANGVNRTGATVSTTVTTW